MLKLEQLKEEYKNKFSETSLEEVLSSLNNDDDKTKINALQQLIDGSLSHENFFNNHSISNDEFNKIKDRLDNSKNIEEDLLYVLDNYNVSNDKLSALLINNYREELISIKEKNSKQDV